MALRQRDVERSDWAEAGNDDDERHKMCKCLENHLNREETSGDAVLEERVDDIRKYWQSGVEQYRSRHRLASRGTKQPA